MHRDCNSASKIDFSCFPRRLAAPQAPPSSACGDWGRIYVLDGCSSRRFLLVQAFWDLPLEETQRPAAIGLASPRQGLRVRLKTLPRILCCIQVSVGQGLQEPNCHETHFGKQESENHISRSNSCFSVFLTLKKDCCFKLVATDPLPDVNYNEDD